MTLNFIETLKASIYRPKTHQKHDNIFEKKYQKQKRELNKKISVVCSYVEGHTA